MTSTPVDEGISGAEMLEGFIQHGHIKVNDQSISLANEMLSEHSATPAAPTTTSHRALSGERSISHIDKPDQEVVQTSI